MKLDGHYFSAFSEFQVSGTRKDNTSPVYKVAAGPLGWEGT